MYNKVLGGKLAERLSVRFLCTRRGFDSHIRRCVFSLYFYLLDRPFCERSICVNGRSYVLHMFLFFPTYFFPRLQTDIFETFPHDVAVLEKEALLCRFPKSAP